MMASRSILPGPVRRPDGDTTRPPLTSLVDMMVILLVFLLKSFSVEGQLVTPAADLQLPPSSVRESADTALSVEVTTSGINLDGVRVAPLPATDADSFIIGGLHTALAELAPTGADSNGRSANVQCDRRVDFAVLKQVLATCSAAGYDDLALLVIQEGS